MTIGITHLSIDWDFFVRCDIPWDGAVESPLYREAKWKSRAVSSQLSPQSPKSWWRQFAEQRVFKNHTVFVADSHRFAANCLAQPGEGLNSITHVDAHHDLGYDNRKQLDCGNWLRHVMERRPAVCARIIYPDWKGLADLNRRDRLWSTDSSLTKRVTLTSWASDRLFYNDDVVTKIFVCRSSAWTHPRHDKAFYAFVVEICKHTNTPFRTPWVDLDGIDPMVPRS